MIKKKPLKKSNIRIREVFFLIIVTIIYTFSQQMRYSFNNNNNTENVKSLFRRRHSSCRNYYSRPITRLCGLRPITTPTYTSSSSLSPNESNIFTQNASTQPSNSTTTTNTTNITNNAILNFAVQTKDKILERGREGSDSPASMNDQQAALPYFLLSNTQLNTPSATPLSNSPFLNDEHLNPVISATAVPVASDLEMTNLSSVPADVMNTPINQQELLQVLNQVSMLNKNNSNCAIPQLKNPFPSEVNSSSSSTLTSPIGNGSFIYEDGKTQKQNSLIDTDNLLSELFDYIQQQKELDKKKKELAMAFADVSSETSFMNILNGIANPVSPNSISTASNTMSDCQKIGSYNSPCVSQETPYIHCQEESLLTPSQTPDQLDLSVALGQDSNLDSVDPLQSYIKSILSQEGKSVENIASGSQTPINPVMNSVSSNYQEDVLMNCLGHQVMDNCHEMNSNHLSIPEISQMNQSVLNGNEITSLNMENEILGNKIMPSYSNLEEEKTLNSFSQKNEVNFMTIPAETEDANVKAQEIDNLNNILSTNNLNHLINILSSLEDESTDDTHETSTSLPYSEEIKQKCMDETTINHENDFSESSTFKQPVMVNHESSFYNNKTNYWPTPEIEDNIETESYFAGESNIIEGNKRRINDSDYINKKIKKSQLDVVQSSMNDKECEFLSEEQRIEKLMEEYERGDAEEDLIRMEKGKEHGYELGIYLKEFPDVHMINSLAVQEKDFPFNPIAIHKLVKLAPIEYFQEDVKKIEKLSKLPRGKGRPRKPRKNSICPFIGCGKKFNREFNLKEHIKIHNPKRLKDFVCKYCNESFYSSSVLIRHIHSIHEGKRFVCNNCGRSFNRKDALHRHEKSSCYSYNDKTGTFINNFTGNIGKKAIVNAMLTN